jgi:HSP20 family protein
MTATSQQPQTVPVQVYQTENLLVLAAPMAGLEPQDISVRIDGDRVAIHGAYRGSRRDQPEVLVSEWTMGPYHREVILPQPVSGVLTNATYGNGVLVLSMPKLEPGEEAHATEFRLEALESIRGQRIGHTGWDIQPTTTRRRSTARKS